MADGGNPPEGQVLDDQTFVGATVNYTGPMHINRIGTINAGTNGQERGAGVVRRAVEGDGATLNEKPTTSLESKNRQKNAAEDETQLSDKIVMCNKQRLCGRYGTRVHLGKQRLTGYEREIAVKLIEYQEKNMREVKALTKLSSHCNVVYIIEAGEYQGGGHWIYIVMELCLKNLQNYIDENQEKPLNFSKSVNYSEQLVKGLAFLHENKVIHRDLKPDNVLISSCENYVKLSDFGLSREIADDRSQVTATNIGAGSEGYKPPEAYQEDPHIQLSFDIFPLGLVIHVLFTNGKHPFGSKPYDWGYNIRNDRNLDLSQIPQFEQPNSHKREQLQDLLRRLLQHRPCDRPAASEVLCDAFFSNVGKDVASLQRAMEATDISQTVASVESLDDAESESGDDKDDFSSSTLRNLSLAEYEDLYTNLPDDMKYSRDFLESEKLDELEGYYELETALSMAESELYLARGEEEGSLQRVENIVYRTPSFTPSRLRDEAHQLLREKSFVHALILHRMSYHAHKLLRVSPDDKVDWLKNCIIDITCAALPLISDGGKSRDIAIKYGLEFMEKLLADLRSIRLATTDTIVRSEADCLVKIAYVCNLVDEHEKAIRYSSDGIEILKNQYHSDVQHLNVYGRLLNNLGVAHGHLGRKLTAKSKYAEALQVYEKADDFVNESEKRHKIKTAKENFDGICKEIKKSP